MPIYYLRLPEEETRVEKLTWLNEMRFRMLEFKELQPDDKGNWLSVGGHDWNQLCPIISKDTKSGENELAIFKLFSLGINTARDEWVYDNNAKNLTAKIKLFLSIYNSNTIQLKRIGITDLDKQIDYSIKWSDELKAALLDKKKFKFQKENIRVVLFRPFTKKFWYSGRFYNKRLHRFLDIFPKSDEDNVVIAFTTVSVNKPFHCLASKHIVDLHYTGDSQCLPRWRYEGETRVDNITDWALAQFQAAYAEELAPHDLRKDDIFHYVYAVLHHPAYRDTYAQNLKRDFPRLPFYNDFRQWANWGAQLLACHLHYDTATPYGLRRHDVDWKLDRGPLPRLKALKAEGVIELDERTSLHGVPPMAWAYQLGNRSALEWVLDQYKERTPKDPTIAAQFDTYRLADHRDEVIALLDQVCAVSVRTQTLLAEMPELPERVVRPS
jgi:predicted helicase